MNKIPLIGLGRLFLLGLLSLLCHAAAQAQVNFVHLTDPHLFDDNWPVESRLDDHAAFASCISEINQRHNTGGKYLFVVVTGDLGIENLVERAPKTKNGQLDEDAIQRSLEKGALELAPLLNLSEVKRWLFVPGNNDVLEEVPRNVRFYHDFVRYLDGFLKDSGTVKIFDLCPWDGSSNGESYASQSAVYQDAEHPDYAFIGFNDASFKNVQRPTDIDSYAETEKTSVLRVEAILQKPEIKYAYVFYHIPEVDDPYAVKLPLTADQFKKREPKLGEIGNSYLYSAWFVRKDVRDEWNKVVENRRVKGLFAGHFHDYKIDTYQNFSWVRTPDYLSGTLHKLHVCPPLALRLQSDTPGEARGFQDVHLDQNGEVSTRIVWLHESQWDFVGPDAEAARDLALARALEASGDEQAAIAAYSKTAGSNWGPSREEALNSLQRLNQPQHYWANKYLLAPLKTGWVAGVNAFGALLFTGLVSLGLIFGGSILVKRYAVENGWNKLRISPMVDATTQGTGASFEHLIRQVHGSKLVHYKKRTLLEVPGATFPLLVTSQSAEIAELIDAVAPGALGKVVVWLRQKSQRPKYEVGGAIQSDTRRQTTLFMAVSGSGETLKRRRETSENDRLPSNQVKLAHWALDVVIKEMNHGRG